MNCERCGKNEANVYIAKIINGIKQDMNICDKCAAESGELNFSGTMGMPGDLSFQNVLSGIMNYINQPNQNTLKETYVCSTCGTTYDDFKNTGLLGCSECYKYFNLAITPVIKRVQGNLENIGKVPLRAGKGLLEKKKLQLLKDELQRVIELEEYERAAEIRDELREIQKGDGKNEKLDES
jgi:protein arginine kinase activator